MVTSNDVARRAGVSQSTVSRIFRGSEAVSDVTRRRVISVADELGYRPNAAARMLVQGRTGIIGVVVADLANPYFPQVIEVLQTELAASGYRMTLIWDRRDGADDTSILSEVAVDGAIFMSALPGSRSLPDFAATGRPVVQISRYDPDVRADLVVADELGGARLLAGHLAGLGHRDVGAVFGPPTSRSSKDRETAFRAAAAECGLNLRDDWVARTPMRHEDAKRAALGLLGRASPPSALFGAGDVLAIAALDAAVGAGINVPAALSVVGFDDSPPAQWSMIELTCVHSPLRRMASSAVKMLLDHLAAPATWTPQRREFPVTLKVRGTTARPRP